MVGVIMYAEIQKLKKLGYKKQRAARELNIDSKTVRKYWDMSEDEYAEYYLATRERTKIMDQYRDYVLEKLKTYPEITSAIIYDNLRDDFTNFAPSYRTVRLYVFTLRDAEGIPTPRKIRQYGETPELPFGFQAQVDMGQKIMKDENGKNVRVYIFAMVLSSSRYKYMVFSLEPFSAKSFVIAHDKAFRYFGGRPAEIVYDQDRVMVVSENGGDIIYTEEFEKYRNYAGFSVHLCRGNDPESKGKIEAVIKYIKNNFLSCRIFHGISKLNSDGLQWLDRTGNGQVHETTKMIPAIVFNKERKYLKPAPELGETEIVPKTAAVRKNNVVMYRQNRYVMPCGTYQPGKTVRIEANEDAGIIEFYDLKTKALLMQYSIAQGIGKCVRDTHPERDKSSKLAALRTVVLSGFDENEKAKEFVDNIQRAKPRYIRDQLSILSRLIKEYSRVELFCALDYCMERNLYSAGDFKDTLEYFRQKTEPCAVSKVSLPIKYSCVTANTRSLDAYSNIYNGADRT